MTLAAVDPGIVGPSYEAPMLLQDAQRCINWYCERDPNQDAKQPMALLGAPGLNPILTTANSPVRGFWPLPGGNQALAAVGAQLWLIQIITPATQASPAVLFPSIIGALNTSTGPVVMRDNGVLQNGVGGYCLIVDGTYCYYYLLTGVTYINTFSAGTSSGSTTLSLPGSLPNGLIVSSGGLVSAASGNFPSNTKIVSINTVTPSITVSNASAGTQANDTITLVIPPFGQITDPGFLGADHVAFIEGWLIFNQPGSRTFFTTGPTPYQVIFPGTFFALKDSSTDNLITLIENERELWLIGERTAEVWYNAGNTNFSFSRIPGVGPQIGCSAKYSIARLGSSIVWLAKNEQGENLVVQNSQYSWQRLSTHAVEHAISGYTVVSDAIGFAYEEEGHIFYVLIFPTADATWVYDATSELWHQRGSFQALTGQFHRIRANCFMDFANMRLVGDYQNGDIHQMSRQIYTDAGNPLVCVRRTPHLWSKENRERIFHSQLQVEFLPGVGLQTGQGSSPTVMLRWSDDGGQTWNNQRTASIGAAGQTTYRAMWRLLGQARDRVYEVSISDPVPRDLIGATLYAEKSMQ